MSGSRWSVSRARRAALVGLFGAALAGPACASDSTAPTGGGAGLAGAKVGAAGGTVPLPFGLAITVPAGATESDVVLDVIDDGPAPSGVLPKEEAVVGHLYRVTTRTPSGAAATLRAPDGEHPITLSLPVPGGVAPGAVGHVYVALPGKPPLPLLLAEAPAGATSAPGPLLEAPPWLHAVVATSKPWVASTTQAAHLGPPSSTQTTPHPPQEWGSVAWDVIKPWYYLSDETSGRATKWLSKGSTALSALGLGRPRLGLTKGGRFLAVIRDNGSNHFQLEPTDKDADLVAALKDGWDLVDDFGSITGAIFLDGTTESYDEDGTVVQGFAPSSCPHELFHAIVAGYGLRNPPVAAGDAAAVKAGAGPLPLPYQPPGPAGHPYFAHRGFEEGLAAMVGHLVVQGDGLAETPLAWEGRGTRLDWPLAIGNANVSPASTDADKAEVYGSMDFFTWLARRHAGGSLAFLADLLDVWSSAHSANYDAMNDLPKWLDGGPATLADAYFDYVARRAFLRDDAVGGVVASQLRGVSKAAPALSDASEHVLLPGIWSTPPATMGGKPASFTAVVPFSARGVVIDAGGDGDREVSVTVAGAAPATSVRATAMQVGNPDPHEIGAGSTLATLGLDPAAKTVVVLVNVDLQGRSADVTVSVGPAGHGGGGGGQGGSGGQGGAGGAHGGAGPGGAGGAGGGAGGALVYGAGDSCAGGLTCAGVSCCETTSVLVGAQFPMGRGLAGTDACPAGMICDADELPEHLVVTPQYYLDTFEATVGRFRRFVEVYDGTPPPAGSGATIGIPDSGWQAAWNAELPATRAALESQLACDPTMATWTAKPAANEDRPINCVTWFEAFAFCIWQGEALPTEVEWEQAAAGGLANRPFPWGASKPVGPGVLSYACGGDGAPGCAITDIAAVGTQPFGDSALGIHDLGGNVAEWTLDWYASDYYANGGAGGSPANLKAGSGRAKRGGAWGDTLTHLRAAARADGGAPSGRSASVGVRCKF